MKKKIYCFDIDGTICNNTFGKYLEAMPYKDRIKTINELYKKGHTIILYSARGSTTGIDWSKWTKKQLSCWWLGYHKLFFGKPNADYFIDDKWIKDEDFFRK